MHLSRRRILQKCGASLAISPIFTARLSERVTPLKCDDLECDSLTFFDQTENPYGPSGQVISALRASAPLAFHYPRTEYDTLRKKIASRHNVSVEQVVVGCGSTEILGLVAKECCGQGGRVIQGAPTCPLLGSIARGLGIDVMPVRLNKKYEHDLDAMLAATTESRSLVYICNPNNPTGTLTSRKDIQVFIEKLPLSTTVLVDEAYYEFVFPNRVYSSFIDDPFDDPRVIVTRTFSKVFGLAGMRVGYAIGAPAVIQRLSMHCLRDGVSVPAVRSALAALDDPEYVRVSMKRNSDSRQEFMNQVNARFLHAIESHANFVMLDPMRPVDQVIEHCANNRIVLPPHVKEMPKYIRISLSTPSNMTEFWRVLDLMPASGKMVM